MRANPITILRKRVAAIKAFLPATYKKIIAEQYPEYNTIEGGELIKNVVNLRSSDLVLTEILEKIAAPYMPVDVAKSDQEQTELQA